MKKKETVKFNRKIKQAKQAGIEAGKKLAEEKINAFKKALVELIPVTQQLIDYTNAGMDVKIKATIEISSSKYLELLRME